MLTKAYGGSRWLHKPLLWRNLCHIALHNAVSVRHANVFIAHFQWFRRSPVSPLQLGNPARMKIHFPGPYCGNNHSLRPSKMTYPHKSWPERHLEWDEQWHGVCKSRPGHGNTMKNISKTKGRHGASFASYCLEKVDNKGQRAIKTKECERQNERNAARDKREAQRNKYWETKNVGVNTMKISAFK